MSGLALTAQARVFPVGYVTTPVSPSLSLSAKRIRVQGKDKDISHWALVLIINPEHVFIGAKV